MSTRRGFLGFLAVGVDAACAVATSGCGNAANRQVSADDAARGRAVDGARTLAALYETAIVRGSVERTQAATFRDHHLAHVARLTSGTGAGAGTGAGMGAGVGDTTAAATGTATVPNAAAMAAAQAGPTRASLATAELSATGTSAADIVGVSGSLGALLASVAACRTLHAQALGYAPSTASSTAPTFAVAKQDGASVAALQQILSAEYAVIFAFGALGPHLAGSQRTAAHSAFDLHRDQRDLLMEAIAASGASPQAAEASYRLPFAVGDAAGAGRLAGLVETRLTAVCAEAGSAASANCRSYAAWALAQAALRAQSWGTPITAFPGLSA